VTPSPAPASALRHRLPALALTGYADAADRALALAAGFDEHLAKPVPPQTLVAALRARCGLA
jgi:ATP-binding cassette, subfamily B, bacterial